MDVHNAVTVSHNVIDNEQIIKTHLTRKELFFI